MAHDSHNTPTPPPAPLGETAKKLRLAMYISLGIAVALNLFIRPHEPHFVVDAWPGFWALFGLVGTFVLVKLSKGSAHTFLGKDEDFYDRQS